MSEITDARHARERGAILQMLAEDYQSEMTSVLTLLRALDAVGVSLMPDGLAFHLRYLAQQGYVQAWRARDMAGYRRDRAGGDKPDTVKFAHLQPKGLQLVDGKAAEDPMVAF